MAGHEGRSELIGKGRDAARLLAITDPAPEARAVLRQGFEERHARGEDRGLGDAGVVETVGRAVEADLTELVAEDAIGLLEDRARPGRGLVHRAAHADGLRALPGEHPCERSSHAPTLASTGLPVVLSVQCSCSEYEAV